MKNLKSIKKERFMQLNKNLEIINCRQKNMKKKEILLQSKLRWRSFTVNMIISIMTSKKRFKIKIRKWRNLVKLLTPSTILETSVTNINTIRKEKMTKNCLKFFKSNWKIPRVSFVT